MLNSHANDDVTGTKPHLPSPGMERRRRKESKKEKPVIISLEPNPARKQV